MWCRIPSVSEAASGVVAPICEANDDVVVLDVDDDAAAAADDDDDVDDVVDDDDDENDDVWWMPGVLLREGVCAVPLFRFSSS